MKVALAHDFLTRLGGAERVLASLAAMYPDAPIYTLLYDAERTGHIFPRERVIASGLQKLPFAKRYPKYLLPLFPHAVEQFDFSDFDMVISSSTAWMHGIITNLETRHVCYYHSPMRFAWDWTHEYLDEQHIGSLKKQMILRMLKDVRVWDFWASKRPQTIIANSHTVSRRIAKYYRRESRAVYPPVDVKRFRVGKHSENYFLIVSQLTPYKRIDLAIELFNKTGERLVIIGDGPERKALEAMAGHTIDFLGFKDDGAVAEYMENCRAFIFPGEEDFGIAPVEVMACGKPVLALKAGGLTETMIEGKTGEFFDEPTVESMICGFQKLISNEREYNPRAIRLHANQFSAEKFEKRFTAALHAERRKRLIGRQLTAIARPSIVNAHG